MKYGNGAAVPGGIGDRMIIVRNATKNNHPKKIIMANEKIDKVLIEILGKDAFYSTDFNVTDNVILLAKAVNYLFTQLGIIQQGMMDKVDIDYINDVKENTIELLQNK